MSTRAHAHLGWRAALCLEGPLEEGHRTVILAKEVSVHSYIVQIAPRWCNRRGLAKQPNDHRAVIHTVFTHGSSHRAGIHTSSLTITAQELLTQGLQTVAREQPCVPTGLCKWSRIGRQLHPCTGGMVALFGELLVAYWPWCDVIKPTQEDQADRAVPLWVLAQLVCDTLVLFGGAGKCLPQEVTSRSIT